jgi:hypothetical protein
MNYESLFDFKQNIVLGLGLNLQKKNTKKSYNPTFSERNSIEL